VTTRIAGFGGCCSGCTFCVATTAYYSSLMAVVVDAAGTAWMADTNNHRIARVTASGMQDGILGGTGTLGFLDAVGVSARFSSPSGLALDSAAQAVIVADTGNHRIRGFLVASYNTLPTTTIAGSGIVALTNGAALSAAFFSPVGVAVGAGGTIYVADLGNTAIRVVAAGVVSTLAGSGVAGAVDGVGAAATFNGPRGVAVSADGTTVFVADTNSQRIRAINGVSRSVTTLAGSGSATWVDGLGTAASFWTPSQIALADNCSRTRKLASSCSSSRLTLHRAGSRSTL
jgi:DNA-binding beta-propeller fold protein YncE